MAAFNFLKIKNIHRETSKAVSISFDVPEALKNTYRFEAGQYLTLKTKINGQEVRRDYSISASPGSKDLTVTVKEIENGLFSSFANQQLNVGDAIEVAPPKGRFTFIPNTTNNTIVAFAAGSGITPIMSILKTVLETNEEQKFILIYGNKSPEETIFYQPLSTLEAQYPNRFQLQYVYSQAQVDGTLFGRIDVGNTNYVIKNLMTLEEASTFYLCGPEGMINTVKDVLLDKKVQEDTILFELFTASTASNEIENAASSDEFVEATILVDDETEVFSMSPGHTILEAALKQDIDVPYSCQGGVCSSCICRLTKGTAEMRQNSVLTDSEVAEGLVLSCQAVPTSSEIHVDFDDV